MTQATTGGSFSLYDEFGGLLLTGTLDSGSLHGTIGPSGTGGFLTANLGTFTGPSSSDTGPSGSAFNQLFKLVDPGSAALAVSLTDVVSIDPVSGPIPGFLVVNGEMQRFTADATANVGASQVPEPGTLSLLLVGVVGAMLMGSRRVLAG